MADPALARLTSAEITTIADGVDAELALIYGDEHEPGDMEFDLLDSDPDPCPDNPGRHLYLGKCGETRCLHCGRIVG